MLKMKQRGIVMVKNLKLLFAVFFIGVCATTIGSNIHSSPVLEYTLLIIGIVLNIASVIGGIMHLWIKSRESH